MRNTIYGVVVECGGGCGGSEENKINLEGIWNKIILLTLKKKKKSFKILCINFFTQQFTQKLTPIDLPPAYVSTQ